MIPVKRVKEKEKERASDPDLGHQPMVEAKVRAKVNQVENQSPKLTEHHRKVVDRAGGKETKVWPAAMPRVCQLHRLHDNRRRSVESHHLEKLMLSYAIFTKVVVVRMGINAICGTRASAASSLKELASMDAGVYICMKAHLRMLLETKPIPKRKSLKPKKRPRPRPRPKE